MNCIYLPHVYACVCPAVIILSWCTRKTRSVAKSKGDKSTNCGTLGANWYDSRSGASISPLVRAERSDSSRILADRSVDPLSLVHSWGFTRELGPDLRAWDEGRERSEAVQNVAKDTIHQLVRKYLPTVLSNLLRTCICYRGSSYFLA